MNKANKKRDANSRISNKQQPLATVYQEEGMRYLAQVINESISNTQVDLLQY
jgi:hypothetical protein